MRTLLILVLFFSFWQGKGQTHKNVDQQNLVWTRYNNLLVFDKKWSLQSEFDNRIFIDPIVQNLFVIRTVGRYKINEQLDAGFGFAYFLTNTQNPNRDLDFEIPEYRIQQDVTYKTKFEKLVINQRFQVEERFIINSTSIQLLPSSTFTWRFRYRLQFEYPLWTQKDQSVKAIVYDEIMVNAGKNVVNNTFDQNRIYTALHYSMTKKLAVELGYMYNYQKRASGVDFFERNIIRVSLYQKIDL